MGADPIFIVVARCEFTFLGRLAQVKVIKDICVLCFFWCSVAGILRIL